MTRPSLTDPAQRRTTRLVLSFLLLTFAVVVLVIGLIYGPDLGHAYGSSLDTYLDEVSTCCDPLTVHDIGPAGTWIARLVGLGLAAWAIIYFAAIDRPLA